MLTWPAPRATIVGKVKSVYKGGRLPGSQLGGVQDSVFAFPLNKRLGVTLGLTPQQRCVALVHGCTLWFHLEGDENWIGRDQRASWSCPSVSCYSPGPANSGSHALPQSHLPQSVGHGHGSGPVAHWMRCKCSCQHRLGSLGQSVGSQRCLSPIQGGCSHLQRPSGEIMGWLIRPLVTHVYTKQVLSYSQAKSKLKVPCYLLSPNFQPHLLYR